MCNYCRQNIFTEREISDLKTAYARLGVLYPQSTVGGNLVTVAYDFADLWTPPDGQSPLPQKWNWRQLGGVLRVHGLDIRLPRFKGLKKERMETVVEEEERMEPGAEEEDRVVGS